MALLIARLLSKKGSNGSRVEICLYVYAALKLTFFFKHFTYLMPFIEGETRVETAKA